MSLLKPLGSGQGFLKAGFLGFTAAGKTYTAMLLAIAARKYFGLSGPVAMFDTEGGSEFVAPWVKDMTGKDFLGVRARSFSDLLAVGKEAESSGVSMLLVDSIAHPWEELKESYKADINKSRDEKGWKPRDLEFQDWSKIKPMWAKWTEFYLNSQLHIIVCGRAGDIYEMEKNEETGRKELLKTGIKMQTEKNFGYEPSLLVEMTREQVLEPVTHFVRRATVWKDRFSVIDGYTGDFLSVDATDPKKREKEMAAVWAFFGPHVTLLKPGSHAPVDVVSKTETGADEEGNADWQREKNLRTILTEEIQGELVAAIPGQSAEEKKRKAQLIFDAFGTRSWTKVEGLNSGILHEGLRKIRLSLNPGEPESPAGPAETATPSPSAASEAPAGDLSPPGEPTPTEKLLIRIQEHIDAGKLSRAALTKYLHTNFCDKAHKEPVCDDVKKLTLLQLQAVSAWLTMM